jgi:hypothetical protein
MVIPEGVPGSSIYKDLECRRISAGSKPANGFASAVSNSDPPPERKTAPTGDRGGSDSHVDEAYLSYHRALDLARADRLIDIQNRAARRDWEAHRRAFGLPAGRVRDLVRFFAFTYGAALPDDDGGRDDFFILAHHAARLNGEPERNIRNHAWEWCPWMPEAELDATVRRVLAKPYKWRPDTLGRKIGLRDSVRTLLGITTIRPIDVPPEQFERGRRERANAKRRKVTRAEYEANSLTKTEPWKAEGICRRTWERRRAQAAASAPVVSPRQHTSLSRATQTCGKPPTPSPAAPPQSGHDGAWALIGAPPTDRDPGWLGAAP